MSTKSTARVSVDKSSFIRLLERRLEYRWLSDQTIVTAVTKDIFGRRHALRKAFVLEVVTAYQQGLLRQRRSLHDWLRRNTTIAKVFKKNKTILLSKAWAQQAEQHPDYRWNVPPIESLESLAQFLALPTRRAVEWLTLPHRRTHTETNHYLRTAVKKRDGSRRWIEQPAPTLKRVQRTIASELLPHIPLHSAACAFRPGTNIVDCAQAHVGRAIVFRIDLKDYFPSISTPRVRALFQMAGYSRPVAKSLSWLCTAPAEVDSDLDQIFNRSRLPQGAPTSPAIANAVSFSMDRRLAGLCDATNVTYTRYADDLIFSSDKFSLAMAKRFATTVSVIAMEEGFQVNFRKTRYMRHGSQQRVLGLIVNQKINSPRQEYEQLKAILHNCKKNGIENENRESHARFVDSLRGRIAHVASINPNRGTKLMQKFRDLLPVG